MIPADSGMIETRGMRVGSILISVTLLIYFFAVLVTNGLISCEILFILLCTDALGLEVIGLSMFLYIQYQLWPAKERKLLLLQYFGDFIYTLYNTMLRF